ncbi:VOC family protein [Marivirga sp. S37H4]|uniref:VOC family protein n=1 Tax=Marivirga aurantiaca TaxID=2802615 RepID=A0A934WXV1_9BACT|nr:VOC family protein [Marivirga aurantiaca]MBK6265154.1 VOC family protein [Marivirga aurantiaca]
MKNPTQPYFHFDGTCREAMTFYQQLFGGDLQLMAINESPMKDQFPKDIQEQILHGSLENGDFRIMASDMCGMGELKQGNSVQINLNCSSEEEINELYKKLPEGGKVVDELNEQFWGALFAMVIDRFGVRWMLSLDK